MRLIRAHAARNSLKQIQSLKEVNSPEENIEEVILTTGQPGDDSVLKQWDPFNLFLVVPSSGRLDPFNVLAIPRSGLAESVIYRCV
jgi:hypothetical protein